MKKGTVTGEIKSILNKLDVKYNECYSDSYANKKGDLSAKKRVGVKFVGVFLTKKQKEVVKVKMGKKGFSFEFIRENYGKGKYYHWNGTRFCFNY